MTKAKEVTTEDTNVETMTFDEAMARAKELKAQLKELNDATKEERDARKAAKQTEKRSNHNFGGFFKITVKAKTRDLIIEEVKEDNDEVKEGGVERATGTALRYLDYVIEAQNEGEGRFQVNEDGEYFLQK